MENRLPKAATNVQETGSIFFAHVILLKWERQFDDFSVHFLVAFNEGANVL